MTRWPRARVGSAVVLVVVCLFACLVVAGCSASVEEPVAEADPSDGSTFEMHAAADAAAEDLEERLDRLEDEPRGRFRYLLERAGPRWSTWTRSTTSAPAPCATRAR